MMQAAMKQHFLTGWVSAPPPVLIGKPGLNPRVLGSSELLNPRTLLELLVVLLAVAGVG